MDLRDPLGLFGDSYERDAGGLLGYLTALVAFAAAVVVVGALFRGVWTVTDALPKWAATPVFFLSLGVLGFGGLYAVLRINDHRRGL